MRILVFTKFKRDYSERDMFELSATQHTIIYANKNNIKHLLANQDYDILWLGIYHHILEYDYQSIFKQNTKPVIIDQSDNEEVIRVKFDYSAINKKLLLSKYLPNKELKEYWNDRIALFQRYINPERFKPREKTIDVSFVCSIYGQRLGNNRVKQKRYLDRVLDKLDLTYITAEVWGKCYNQILGRSKAIIVDGSRNCMTAKYLEASLAECVIIGEKPIYPKNNIQTIPFDLAHLQESINSRVNVAENKKYVLDTYCNKEYFLTKLNRILWSAKDA